MIYVHSVWLRKQENVHKMSSAKKILSIKYKDSLFKNPKSGLFQFLNFFSVEGGFPTAAPSVTPLSGVILRIFHSENS